MLEDGVHGVARLLPGYPEILLKRPSNRREDGLSSFVRIQGTGGSCKINLVIESSVIFFSSISSDHLVL